MGNNLGKSKQSAQRLVVEDIQNELDAHFGELAAGAAAAANVAKVHGVNGGVSGDDDGDTQEEPAAARRRRGDGDCCLLNLPADVLVFMLSFLDLRSVVSTLHTCRRINALGNSSRLWQDRMDRLLLPTARKTAAQSLGSAGQRQLVLACQMWDDPAHHLAQRHAPEAGAQRKRWMGPKKKSINPVDVYFGDTGPYILRAAGDVAYLGTLSDDMHIIDGPKGVLREVFHVSTDSSGNYRLNVEHNLLLSSDHGIKLIDVEACRVSHDTTRSPLKGVLSHYPEHATCFDWLGCKEFAFFQSRVQAGSSDDDNDEANAEKKTNFSLSLLDLATATVVRKVPFAKGDVWHGNWELASSCGMGTNTAVTCDDASFVWLDSRVDTIVGATSAPLGDDFAFSAIKANGGLALAVVRNETSARLAVCEQRMASKLRFVALPEPGGYFDMDEAKAVWMSPLEGLCMWNSSSNEVSTIVPNAPGAFVDFIANSHMWRIAMGDSRIFMVQPNARVVRMF